MFGIYQLPTATEPRLIAGCGQERVKVNQLSCQHYAAGGGNTYIRLLIMTFSIAEWYVEGYILAIRGVLAPWLLGDFEVYIVKIPYKMQHNFELWYVSDPKCSQTFARSKRRSEHAEVRTLEGSLGTSRAFGSSSVHVFCRLGEPKFRSFLAPTASISQMYNPRNQTWPQHLQ